MRGDGFAITTATRPRVADRVLELDHGAMCEQGQAARVLVHPTSETTRQLLAACRSLGSELEQRRTGQENSATVVRVGEPE